MRFILRREHEDAFRFEARRRFAARLVRYFGQKRPGLLDGIPPAERENTVTAYLGDAIRARLRTEASLARYVEARILRRGDLAFERWSLVEAARLPGNERARSERVLATALETDRSRP